MGRPPVIAAYTGPDEAADALALGGLLADLTRSRLTLARPKQRGGSASRLRASLPAARDYDILPLADGDLAHGVHELCTSEGAGLLVVGAKRRRSAGRVLGTTAEYLAPRARCPVAVAPPGFRFRSALTPGVIGVAFDGSPTSAVALEVGFQISAATGAGLRVIGVRAPGERQGPAEVAIETLLPGLPGNAEAFLLDGDAGPVLAGATDGWVGLLVMGGPRNGPVRHALGGSTVGRVLGAAAAPVLLCPPGQKVPDGLFEPLLRLADPEPVPEPSPGSQVRRTLHLDWGAKPPKRRGTPVNARL